MKKLVTLLFISFFTLIACGQKGALYLPQALLSDSQQLHHTPDKYGK